MLRRREPITGFNQGNIFHKQAQCSSSAFLILLQLHIYLHFRPLFVACEWNLLMFSLRHIYIHSYLYIGKILALLMDASSLLFCRIFSVRAPPRPSSWEVLTIETQREKLCKFSLQKREVISSSEHIGKMSLNLVKGVGHTVTNTHRTNTYI